MRRRIDPILRIWALEGPWLSPTCCYSVLEACSSSVNNRTQYGSGAARGLLPEGLNGSHKSLSVVEPFLLCRDNFHDCADIHGQSLGLTSRQGGGLSLAVATSEGDASCNLGLAGASCLQLKTFAPSTGRSRSRHHRSRPASSRVARLGSV